MSLSICLVTRDAADRVGRALSSVAHLGAQLLVADTGSTDDTVAVARMHGAQTLVVPWNDDFSEAQNLALERAVGDWVLWLNPDEEYVGPVRPAFMELLAKPDALAHLVRVAELTHPERPFAAVESLQVRLIRRHPEFRYVGRLHPHLWPNLDDLARRTGKKVQPCDVLLRRHAYLSVLTEQKLRWATRLLALELRDRPGQLHYLIEFGRNLLRLNDPDGHGVLADAAEIMLRSEAATAPPAANVASLLEYALTVSAEQRVGRLTPLIASELAQRWFPNSPPLLMVLADRAYHMGEYAEAAKVLEWLDFLGRSGSYDRSTGFDPALVAELAVLNLGLCHLKLGDADGAEGCFRRLLDREDYADRGNKGLAEVAALRRRLSGLN